VATGQVEAVRLPVSVRRSLPSSVLRAVVGVLMHPQESVRLGFRWEETQDDVASDMKSYTSAPERHMMKLCRLVLEAKLATCCPAPIRQETHA
jgi:hypothetical protein